MVTPARFIGVLAAVIIIAVAGVWTLQRSLFPTSQSDWPALVVASASLVVSALAFFVVEMQGAAIAVRPPETKPGQYVAQLSVWIGDGSFNAAFEWSVLIVNEGPRAGVLEDLTFGSKVRFAHKPRMLAGYFQSVYDERGEKIRLPLAIRDGELLVVRVVVMLSPLTTNGDFAERIAHDLLELHSIELPYSYTFSSRRRATTRSAVLSASLDTVRTAARDVWQGQPACASAYTILTVKGEA